MVPWPDVAVLVMRSPADLHPYQRDAVDFLYDRPGALLLADLGLGKTAVSLTLLARLKAEGLLGRALVIGPLRVVNETWPSEFRAWSHTQGLKLKVLTGSEADRRNEMERRVAGGADVHLINREQAEWLVSQFVRPKGKKWEMYRRWFYDTVVIDEATSFGDASSNRFRALKLIRKHTRKIVELTATPTAEGYMKLFAMMYLVDGGARLGTHITHYRNAYFKQNIYTRAWELLPGAAEQITNKIADVALLLRAEDHLPRNKPTFIDRRVTLTDTQMEDYRRFEREAYFQTLDGAEITAVHAAALQLKLLQMASGSVYDAERVAHRIHDHKTEALAELVEEAQGENLMVAYWFKSSLERLRKAFPKAVVMDREGKAVAAWNAGKTRMLLVHPQSAGHGLNLQGGGAVLVWYDIPASLELYLQTIGRIDRQGQTRPVRVYRLIATGTADEDAIERLDRKESVQDAFFRRLKEWKERNASTVTRSGPTRPLTP